MVEPFRMLAISAALSAAIIGVSIAPLAAEQRPGQLGEAERQACLKDGGHIAIMGLSGNEGCARPMADAGKQCSDGAQCLSHQCVIEDERAGLKAAKAKRKVKGTCARTDYVFGCRTRLNNGYATTLCVD